MCFAQWSINGSSATVSELSVFPLGYSSSVFFVSPNALTAGAQITVSCTFTGPTGSTYVKMQAVRLSRAWKYGNELLSFLLAKSEP